MPSAEFAQRVVMVKWYIPRHGIFFSWKVLIFILFVCKSIPCWYSLEAPHKALLMSTHNICCCGEIRKIFWGYPLLSGTVKWSVCLLQAVDEELDMKTEGSSLKPSTTGILTVSGQSSTAGNQLSSRTSQELDQDTEEALMKKGRLLLQHLQNLDAKLGANNSGSSQPLFTTVSFARTLQPSAPGNILTAKFSPAQVQVPSVSQTMSASNLLLANSSQSSSLSQQRKSLYEPGQS